MRINRSNKIKFGFKVNYFTEIIQVTKAELSSYIAKMPGRIVIITDMIFMKRHAVFFRGLASTIPVLQMPITTNTKNAQDLKAIYDFLLKEQVQRSTHVIVFGGGTLTDLASFAVSTFKRGAQLILVPTTVVGMVDASLGGKTAYDMDHLKNMIGSFYPAGEVYFCYDFLKTLEQVDVLNGWAEIVKMFLVHQEMELPEFLELTYLPPKELIWQAAGLKMSICSSDLQDTEGRRLLNLGHTFAHVLEAVSRHEIPHGIAVVFGIHAAALLSFRLGMIDEILMTRIRNLFHDFHLTEYVTEELISNILQNGLTPLLQDKKAEHGLKLILFQAWRELIVVDIPDATNALDCLTDVLRESK